MGNPVLSQKKHTQRLMQRIKETRARRVSALAQSKWMQDRVRTIVESRRRAPMDFWCETCHRDFSCVDALKIVRIHQGIPRAFYEGMCPAKHTAIRHITDKHLDPYYHLSAMMRLQRREMADDILTPSDPRFKIVYPKQWAQLEAEREQREQQEAAENEQLYG